MQLPTAHYCEPRSEGDIECKVQGSFTNDADSLTENTVLTVVMILFMRLAMMQAR